jgi:branched-chain amino acid transport system substrate-binding protein
LHLRWSTHKIAIFEHLHRHRPVTALHSESSNLLKRVLRQIVVFVLLCAAIPATVTITSAQTFKIGLSLPLSGNLSLLSEHFLSGAKLAMDALAPGEEIELVEVDDGCDGDLARLAGEDLRNAQVSIVTGFLCASSVAVIADALKESRVPLLVAGARADYPLVESEEEHRNIWRMAQGEEFGADAAYRFLAARWQARPWALVDDGTIFGRTLAEDLRAKMEENGQPPQMVESIRPGSFSKASLVRRLNGASVAEVFVAANAQDTAAIWKEITDMELAMEVAGGEALAQLPWIEEAQGLPDGLLAIMLPGPAQLTGYKGLANQMKQAGIEPEPYTLLGYAAMEVAMASLRQTPEQTTQALRETVFRTVLGNVKFDAEHKNQVNWYRPFVWRDGDFDPLENFDR